jgi:amidohydrolase
MRTIDDLKSEAYRLIDQYELKISEIGDAILCTPELGFKEHRTAQRVVSLMTEFDISHQAGLAVTGVKGILKGKKPGPTLALLAELDSLLVCDHPYADLETGAAHACGHNGQIAALMGAMIALKTVGIEKDIAGNIVFFAVPAEECVEIRYRLDLVKQGKIGFLAGKQELVRLGCFNDIQMAVMIHGHNRPDAGKIILGTSSNGCVVKLIRYIGKAAHAGSAPHMGINALNAAHIGLAAIHAQRETFRDSDTIRVHPIITRGGDLVNVVPSEVCMETFVRGKTNKAIADAEQKVDRALRAGAMAIGAQVEIKTIPGYMPLMNDPGLSEIFLKNAEALVGKDQVAPGGHGAGSTDMGDISHLMPALHPYIGGVAGTSHGADYAIVDKKLHYLGAAKLLAATAIDLLYDEAQNAKEILKNFKPAMSIEEYLKYQKDVFRTERYGETRGQGLTP